MVESSLSQAFNTVSWFIFQTIQRNRHCNPILHLSKLGSEKTIALSEAELGSAELSTAHLALPPYCKHYPLVDPTPATQDCMPFRETLHSFPT